MLVLSVINLFITPTFYLNFILILCFNQKAILMGSLMQWLYFGKDVNVIFTWKYKNKNRPGTLFTKQSLISGPVKLTEKLTHMSAKFESGTFVFTNVSVNVKLAGPIGLFWKGCKCIIQSKYLIQLFLLICILSDPLTWRLWRRLWKKGKHSLSYNLKS
jgi:hypothetical protein